ncbi:MAG: hypothetical protein Q4F24_06530 [Eubacteriales bacterium]|nr:hypothetical protein [Eubacteriales bacterium]
MCQTTSILFFIIGGALSVYHREFWENSNSNHLETVFYIALFLIDAAIRWLSISYFSTIALVLSPILFWKSCELLGQMNVFDHEPFWFCKQRFFIYAAHIFPVEGLSSILSKANRSMVWVIICDLNKPIPEEYRNKFTCIIDGGTTEHVFSFDQAMENVIDLLDVGATILE